MPMAGRSAPLTLARLGCMALHSQKKARGGFAMTRILVIDDEARLREALRRMLEKAGYEVIEAENGKIGLQLLHSASVDIVLTDIFMPEIDGIETIRILQHAHPHVKIIAVSGGGHGSSLDALSLAQALGARRTLTKPFERQEILEAVHAVLAQ